MVLKAAASAVSSVLPGNVLGLVTDHPHFHTTVNKLGITKDSPHGVLLAAAIVTALPCFLLVTAMRVVGAKGRRERAYMNDSNVKVVLVTGASGGLGKRIVDAMRQQFPNAVVYGTSRKGWVDDGSSGGGTSESDDTQLPLGVTDWETTKNQPLLQLDINDEQSVTRCITSIKARHGRLDVLVNNAGSVVATHAANTDANDALDQMNTNFFGAVRVVRHCFALMKGGKNEDANNSKAPSRNNSKARCVGRIINIGSIGGRIGLPYQSIYSASKAATQVWSDSLRMETWNDGIYVSLVEPGDLKPGMLNARKAQGFDDDPVAKRATDIMRAEEADGTDPKAVAKVVIKICKSTKPAGRYLVGPDAWLVEMLTRLVPHSWQEYFLASHYRVPPRHNAWIRV
jgi:NAD(P)-dependent dehydrogenase (short-subunit alcohol dehydrogenase family)|tara:strand:+ start:26682 stop:27878 length:1197 start_codon:yes stop_codon:yes gene_type:complete